jgi:hypothetical protein
MTSNPHEAVIRDGSDNSDPADLNPRICGRLARPLDIERSWSPDQAAMVAALRVVLDLPRHLPDRGLRGVR